MPRRMHGTNTEFAGIQYVVVRQYAVRLERLVLNLPFGCGLSQLFGTGGLRQGFGRR